MGYYCFLFSLLYHTHTHTHLNQRQRNFYTRASEMQFMFGPGNNNILVEGSM